MDKKIIPKGTCPICGKDYSNKPEEYDEKCGCCKNCIREGDKALESYYKRRESKQQNKKKWNIGTKYVDELV
ncbi:MAG: hypothetical protein U9R08_02830 [Nanoarchaeota archaeon]|nr:hypothetical protein [Nanoarchaeota archaeon]